MKEQLRMLGIDMGRPGTRLIEMLMDGQLKLEDLTDEDIDLILDAWDTRNFVPVHKMGSADKVSPQITEKDVKEGLYTEAERRRNYVEMIMRYISTM